MILQTKIPYDIKPVGSRVTCDPAPTDTDRDWIVLVPAEGMWQFERDMEAAGWEKGGSNIPHEGNTIPPEDRFASFTLGVDNIIVTSSFEFCRRFLAATHVAKRLNLLVKADRIALFQAVLYGSTV